MNKNPQNVIIIGASSGIGRLIAETYIRRGLRIGIAARRVDKLQSLQALAPDRVVAHPIDVTQPDAGNRLLALIEAIGSADLIINVAGVGFQNPNLIPEKDMNMVTTNCDGFTRIVSTAFRYFASKGQKVHEDSKGQKVQGVKGQKDQRTKGPWGQIAAVSSIASTKGLGLAAAYSASKSYQAQYLKALDQLAHLRHYPIKITDIRPGFIDTDLLNDAARYPMLMSPQYAAKKIVKAIDRHRRVAVIDWRWNIVVGLWRMIPGWLWPLLPVKIE